MTCAEVQELIDLYVLSALPPDLAEGVEQHLDLCDQCQAEVERAWSVAAALRVAVPQRDPPPALGRRIAEEALGGSRRLPLVFSTADTATSGPRTVGLRWLAVAAALPLLLSAFLAVRVASVEAELDATRGQLRQSWAEARAAASILGTGIERGSAMTTPVEGTEMAPFARGMLYYMPGGREAVLVVEGLPSPGRDQIYRVWLVRDEQAVNAGNLYLEEGGRGMLVVHAPMPLSAMEAVRVTNEPRGADDVPRGAGYMWGKLKKV